MQLSKIIYSPIVTEKSLAAKAERNVYVFKVKKEASKGSIANEIKRLFGVDVEDVRTMIFTGKNKRLRRTRFLVKTQTWKKALVTLKSGQKIDLFPEG